ncbi:MAG TPA: hypothetical protein EYH31_10295 [Anaerolineae bacterium]|nr:hypothetical protein [Anaerolineae bacterium]
MALVAVLLIGGGALFWSWPTGGEIDVTPQVRGAPRVEVLEEVMDYGDVRVNTPIRTVFRVRNVGDQPLRILGEPQVELVQGC